MIGGDPSFYLRWTLGGWGMNGMAFIEPVALAEYERCFARADATRAAGRGSRARRLCSGPSAAQLGRPFDRLKSGARSARQQCPGSQCLPVI